MGGIRTKVEAFATIKAIRDIDIAVLWSGYAVACVVQCQSLVMWSADVALVAVAWTSIQAVVNQNEL